MVALRLEPSGLMLGAATLLRALPSALAAQEADPLASSSGAYPTAEVWSGTLPTANIVDPDAPVGRGEGLQKYSQEVAARAR